MPGGSARGPAQLVAASTVEPRVSRPRYRVHLVTMGTWRGSAPSRSWRVGADQLASGPRSCRRTFATAAPSRPWR